MFDMSDSCLNDKNSVVRYRTPLRLSLPTCNKRSAFPKRWPAVLKVHVHYTPIHTIALNATFVVVVKWSSLEGESG